MSPVRRFTAPSAHELRHYVTIQQATETQSGDGAVVQTWGTFAAVWAAFRPVSGGEGFASQGINASVVHLVDMRYRAGVTPKMRILWGTRTFDIQNVLVHEEHNRWMTLACVESV